MKSILSLVCESMLGLSQARLLKFEQFGKLQEAVTA